jgi:hypothetical protein
LGYFHNEKSTILGRAFGPLPSENSLSELHWLLIRKKEKKKAKIDIKRGADFKRWVFLCPSDYADPP